MTTRANQARRHNQSSGQQHAFSRHADVFTRPRAARHPLAAGKAQKMPPSLPPPENSPGETSADREQDLHTRATTTHTFSHRLAPTTPEESAAPASPSSSPAPSHPPPRANRPMARTCRGRRQKAALEACACKGLVNCARTLAKATKKDDWVAVDWAEGGAGGQRGELAGDACAAAAIHSIHCKGRPAITAT